jgi:signal transduction histidine kinase
VQVLHSRAEHWCNFNLLLPRRMYNFVPVETIENTTIAPPGQSLEAQRSAQEEKRDLLARLLAHLAHEIRNPLSSLDIHVQLLEEDFSAGGINPPSRTFDRFQIIRGEIRRLENIVTRFLQLAGPSALETKLLSLNLLANQTCDLLRADAVERGVELTLDLAVDLPSIDADPVQLSQALINLIINALQATPAKGHVLVRTRLEKAGYVAVDVSDDGPGIDPEDHAKIFEPYFTTKSEGSGLGLWITQQIVHAHGGSLLLESGRGRGSTFTLSIPIQRSGVMSHTAT